MTYAHTHRTHTHTHEMDFARLEWFRTYVDVRARKEEREKRKEKEDNRKRVEEKTTVGPRHTQVRDAKGEKEEREDKVTLTRTPTHICNFYPSPLRGRGGEPKKSTRKQRDKKDGRACSLLWYVSFNLFRLAWCFCFCFFFCPWSSLDPVCMVGPTASTTSSTH